MADTNATFIKSLRAIASGTLNTEHPDPEKLIEYEAGEVAESEAQRIRAHLAVCSDCTQVVVDLAAFPEIELRNENLSRTRIEEAADWQDIEKKMALEGIHSPLPVLGRRNQHFSWIHGLAACLAVATLGLSLWVANLERKVQSTSEPQANIFIGDLLPATIGSSRAATSENTIFVPAGVSHVVLVLALADFQLSTDYQVEILDADGAPRWSQRGLVRMPDGSFTLEIEPALFPSGDYHIQLLGSRAGKQKLLATYPLRITYASVP